MGVRNLRAICPACGGKIHTQAKGLGHITWANSWFLVQTGTECQWCGVALTGKVKADGRAELVGAPQTTFSGAVKTAGANPPPAPTAAATRYRVTTPDGQRREFDTYSAALVFEATSGGELQRL